MLGTLHYIVTFYTFVALEIVNRLRKQFLVFYRIYYEKQLQKFLN